MRQTHFVLDCSISIAWAFEDEENTYAWKVFDSLSKATAYVPLLLSIETDNVLLINEKKSRITHQQALKFKRNLKNLPIIKNYSENDFYELARDFKLTTYDASYLELALRKKMPIATLDKELRQAAKRCKIELYLE